MDISVWFCCLHPDESAALQLCVDAFVSSLGQGFPKFVFDAYWEIFSPLTDARENAFAQVFPIEFTMSVPDEETEPIPWVAFNDPLWWSQAAVYVLNPLNQCVDGCQLCSYLVLSENCL